jgi:replicative DNA helicase
MYNLPQVYSVTAEYFLIPENREIYSGIRLIKDKSLDFDVQTLITLIHSNINDKSHVSYEKVSKIYKSFPEFRNIQFCIQLLKDDYVKYITSKKLFREVVNIVSNKTMLNINKLLTASQEIVNTLTNIKENSDDILLTSEMFSQKYLEVIEKRLKGEQLRSLGHTSLDEVILRPGASGEITYVAGESGSGKSIFVQDIEHRLLKKNICVLKFSIEMDF